jgi:hypothetical protein
MNSSSALGGGKKSSASASTRSETPISDSGDFGNFASFDQVFEETASSFDPFHDDGVVELDTLMDRINADDTSFSLAFDDQCQIGSPSQRQEQGRSINNHAAESSFEVTFQGFGDSVPSVFSTEDHYFSNSNNNNDNDGFGDVTIDQSEITNQITSPSSKKFFGFGGGSSDANTASAKKKRSGVFGILGKR